MQVYDPVLIMEIPSKPDFKRSVIFRKGSVNFNIIYIPHTGPFLHHSTN